MRLLEFYKIQLMSRILKNLIVRITFLWCCCTAAHAFDTASFLDMSEEQQRFYLLGIIDGEVHDLPAEQVYCVMKWARDDMLMFLSDWYSAHTDYKGEVPVAFIVSKELDIVCKRGANAS